MSYALIIPSSLGFRLSWGLQGLLFLSRLGPYSMKSQLFSYRQGPKPVFREYCLDDSIALGEYNLNTSLSVLSSFLFPVEYSSIYHWLIVSLLDLRTPDF